MPNFVTRRRALNKTFQYTLLMAALTGLAACEPVATVPWPDSTTTVSVEEATAAGPNSPSATTGDDSTVAGDTAGDDTSSDDLGALDENAYGDGTGNGAISGENPAADDTATPTTGDVAAEDTAPAGDAPSTDTTASNPTDSDAAPGTDAPASGDDVAADDTAPVDNGTTAPASGRTLTLSWQAPLRNVDGTVLSDLAGYRVYWGVAPGVYTDSLQIKDPLATHVTLNAPGPGTYYFVATAYDNDAHEGPYSNMTSVVIN